MNHFVHCCSFSTSNKIPSTGCQSASQTFDFDAKKCKIFLGRGHSHLPRPLPRAKGDTASPHSTLLGAFGASILIAPILKFCLRYWHQNTPHVSWMTRNILIRYVCTRCLPCVALSWGQPIWQGLRFSKLVHKKPIFVDVILFSLLFKQFKLIASTVSWVIR